MMKLVFLFIILSFDSFGQKHHLEFDFYSDEVKLYAIGENHKERNAELQLSVLEYLLENSKIDYVIFEFSHQMGKVLNDYVLTGNRKKDAETLIKLLPRKSRLDCFQFIEYLRKYNLNRQDDEKIQVFTVDHFEFDDFSDHTIALSIFFPELNGCGTELSQELLFGKKRHYSYKKGFAMLNSLLEDFKNNEQVYRNCLNDRYLTYQSQLIQVTDIFKQSNRLNDSLRENYMYSMLKPFLVEGVKCFAIFGDKHVINKQNDNWFTEYPFTSLMANAKSDFPSQTYSIVTQDNYGKRINNFFYAFNLLSSPLETYFPDNKSKYVLIDEKEVDLNHPIASERCDMVIIQNKRWKKRKSKR